METKDLQKYSDYQQQDSNSLKNELLELKAKKKIINWGNFSFDKSRELLKDIKGNLSDLVTEEREER